jgi:hypothetical protein
MDRKPQTQIQRYPLQRNYNRNYVAEVKTDNNHIDTIYTNISTGEYHDIITIIDGNNILNFRNKEGETLIHAILKNPSSSLTEQQILNIIQKLVHKNVSINAMNEYNQTALHLAAKKGFYDVIDYLISLKSDFDKIDNYGNAPVHYLIDNFVSDCKEGEYFKISNKKIKKSLKNVKYEEATEKYIIYHLIEELETKTGDKYNKPQYFFERIKNCIERYKFFKINDINEIINSKKNDFDNLYKKHNPEILETETKKIMYNAVSDFFKLYKDFEIDNKTMVSGENNFLNDETLNKIKQDLPNKENLNNDDFKKKIDVLKENMNEIIKYLETQSETIYTLIKLLYFATYIYYSYSEQQYNRDLRQTNMNIIDLFFIENTIDTKYWNFNEFFDTQNFLDEEYHEKKTYFLRSLQNNVIKNRIPLNYETLAREHILDAGINYNNPKINFIFFTTIRHFLTKKCILVILINIINYCILLLNNTLELINNIEMKNYGLFYLNYIDEVVINIVNNMSVYKKIYDMINIDKVIENVEQLFNYLGVIQNVIYSFLSSQIDHITDDIEYDTTTPEIRKKLNQQNNRDSEEVIESIRQKILKPSVYDLIEKIYTSSVKLKRNNGFVLSCTNRYYSLKYLKYLIEMTENNPINNHTIINFFCVNNFYENEAKMPKNFTDYFNKYSNNGVFDDAVFNNINKDLLKKYYDYDFNKIFLNQNSTTTSLETTYKYNNIIIRNAKYYNKEKRKLLNIIIPNYKTGYNYINYSNNPNVVANNSIFSQYEPPKNLIEKSNTLKWLFKNSEFVVADENIPYVSLDNIKNIIQLFCFKMFSYLDNNDFNNIINKTSNKIKTEIKSDKILKLFDETFDYLKKPENEALLKKVITEKFLIFIESYIKK